MTFTILARDPLTGELGAGSFTFGFAVGAGMAHHAPSAGLVVVQARGDVAWAEQLLPSLAPGRWADVLDDLAADDRLAAGQLAALSVTGEAFCHTGSQSEHFADGACGQDLVCAANLMAVDGVPRLTAQHFRELDPSLTLADRLVAALQHADSLGGDVRGRMSAFVRTFPTDRATPPVDLRVDFHHDAVTELARHSRIGRAHALAATAVDAHGSYADVEVTRAAYQLAPDSPVTASAYLLARLRAGDTDEPALTALSREVVALAPQLRERLRRLEANGRLPEGTAARVGRLLPGGGY